MIMIKDIGRKNGSILFNFEEDLHKHLLKRHILLWTYRVIMILPFIFIMVYFTWNAIEFLCQRSKFGRWVRRGYFSLRHLVWDEPCGLPWYKEHPGDETCIK